MSSAGKKIIAGLREAIAGNFARVTIEGQTWVRQDTDPLFKPRHIDEYHEDRGPVLWWTNPIDEAPWCGNPENNDWPGYHQWWTPLPDCNRIQKNMPKVNREKTEPDNKPDSGEVAL